MKEKQRFLLLAVVLAVSTGLACQAPPTAKPAQTVTPSPIASPMPAWQKTWDEWVAAAKKEGKVVIYSVMVSATLRQGLSDGFKKAYGIDTEIVAAPEVYERLMKERAAGLYLADLHLGPPLSPLLQLMPAGALDPIPPVLILPEVVDGKLWYGGAHVYVDEAAQYIFSLPAQVSRFLTINTDLVKPEEIRTWDALLDPKWKGKIVMDDPTRAFGGTASAWFMWMAEEWRSPDWMRRFVPQVAAVTRDERMAVEWIARGKYAMGIADRGNYLTFKEAGLPVDLINPSQEPALLSGGPGISLINKAPRPNAAKVFINWYLSREGQTIYSKAVGEPSRRLDVPTDHLDSRTVPDPKKTYFSQSSEKWIKEAMAKQAQRIALAKEIFAPLLEKQ